MTSGMIWEHVKGDIVTSSRGCIVFDDTVLDKNHSHAIEMVRRQYSGNAHGLIKGIGMVNCLYVNPDSGHYWIVDYRLFDPDHDGQSKLDHVEAMLTSLVASKGIAFERVLMDSCRIPDDCIDPKRHALFVSRAMFAQLIEDIKKGLQ